MNKDFSLQTNASKQRYGAFLFQEGGVVGYFSKQLEPHQENYSVIEIEALVVVKALSHFRQIILFSHILIETDYSNLECLDSSPLQRVQRWRILISEFNTSIKYIPGSKNVLSDVLYRNVFLVLDENLKEKIKKLHEQLNHP